MSEPYAIHLSNVGKKYKVYANKLDKFIDVVGLHKPFPFLKIQAPEFWALRGIDLAIPRGRRIGLVGRNGAGKSTLLKAITGTITPTEGTIEVNGKIQALFDMGAGFHPEFTGIENIKASLTYQGVSYQEIKSAIDEIVDFTELGQFIHQPFKYYSLGMQSRLTFATATYLRPDILIIDEVLGAGDAYFAHKSGERMRSLVEESGATVILVSHAMDQIQRYCEECLWIERGEVVSSGSTLEVIKEYSQYIQKLNNTRLLIKNRRATAKQSTIEFDSQYIGISFLVSGPTGAKFDLSEVQFFGDGALEEVLTVGGVQDSSPIHNFHLKIENSDWTEDQIELNRKYRSIRVRDKNSSQASGDILLYYNQLSHAQNFKFMFSCRRAADANVEVVFYQNGERIGAHPIISTENIWSMEEVSFPFFLSSTDRGESSPQMDLQQGSLLTISRWGGTGAIRIESVRLIDPIQKTESGVFQFGKPIKIEIDLRAIEQSSLYLVVTIALYRLDGILVTKFRSTPERTTIPSGELLTSSLSLTNPLLLNGDYVISVAVFDGEVNERTRIDLVDRSYQFEITGAPSYYQGAVVNHPQSWEHSS
jgi:lipopolysaccharide transport system ATP-binding protein